MLLRPGTSTLFHPAARNGIINLNDNEAIELYCSTGFAAPSGAGNSITATCTTGNRFLYNGLSYTFATFVCTGYTAHSARKTGARCYNNGYVIEHGFPVGSDRFVKTFDVCHDELTEANYYAAYKFTPANDGFQSSENFVESYRKLLITMSFVFRLPEAKLYNWRILWWKKCR